MPLLAPPVFILEGGVGVGKSAALRELRQIRPEFIILTEPVGEWSIWNREDARFSSLLEDFYRNPNSERHFRLLQMQVCISLLERHQHCQSILSNYGYRNNVTVGMERSLRASDEVFLASYSHATLVPEMSQISSLCQWGVRAFETGVPSVFLHCSDATAWDRIQRRGRPEEATITQESVFLISRNMSNWAARRGQWKHFVSSGDDTTTNLLLRHLNNYVTGLHHISTEDRTPVQVAMEIEAWLNAFQQQQQQQQP